MTMYLCESGAYTQASARQERTIILKAYHEGRISRRQAIAFLRRVEPRHPVEVGHA